MPGRYHPAARSAIRVHGTGPIANAKSEWTTVDEKKHARQQAVEEQLRVYRSVLPTLLKRFEQIPDPRNPKTIKHKSTVLLLYGILVYAFQMTSRREANSRSLTRSISASFSRSPAPYSSFAISAAVARNSDTMRFISSRVSTTGSLSGLLA